MGDKEDYWNFAQVGLELAGAVLLGLLGGWWLDRRLDTLPWLTLLCSSAGLGGGMYIVIKKLLRSGERPPKGKP